jgi:hypothetical protein
MATVNKDFKIKHGLVVEGLEGTINGEVILTENASDSYILGLTGGATLVKSVSNEFDVSAGGELSIDRVVVDTYYDEAGSAAAAQTAAEATASADATSKANAAQEAAEDYADGLAVNYDAAGSAAAAQTAAQTYADGLAVNYDAAGSAAAAQTAAEGFATQAIANLVDSAPETLDTLNELAAALQDNPDIIADLQGIAAGKQDELTAGANIDITGATISVTGLDAADISDFDAAAVLATAASYDATGTAQGIVDALDTDDIEEGSTNLYFSDVRAKTSAAQLLTGATLDNITITGDENGLTITAENGVADSTTDDLDEGTTNKYFTDVRAVDALEAVVPNFTAVELNSVAKHVAATLEAATAGIQVAHAFAKADYRSAEYLVKVAYGTHTEISKVLLTLDTSDNIAITEYGIVGTNGSASTISAGISGANVQLLVTTANNTSVVTVVGTLVA